MIPITLSRLLDRLRQNFPSLSFQAPTPLASLRYFLPFQSRSISRPTASACSPRHTPHDILTFRRSRFAYTLNQLSKRNHPLPYTPDPPSPLDNALTHHGLLYEQEVVDQLVHTLSETTHLQPCDILIHLPSNAFAETQDALKSRIPLIRNPTLRDEHLNAAADLLLRADLDPYVSERQRRAAKDSQYVVLEIKLASKCTAEHALQAAAYVHLLDEMEHETGVKSASWAYVVTGDERRLLNTFALGLLWRRCWHEFQSFATEIDSGIPAPEGCGEDVRPWTTAARHILENEDSLRLLAGIRAREIDNIGRQFGAKSVEEFAGVSEELVKTRVQDGQLSETYLTLWRQARMQVETRRTGKTSFEIIWEGGGVIPRARDSDVVFDMEGFPLIKGGLEYLFGALGSDGKFRWWWAHDRTGEERAFVGFVEWLRDKLDAGGYVYHYGHYEISALRRVGLRATTAEGIEAARYLEEVVEDGRFLDVFKIVKECLVVGEESYSIKKIEKLVGISRVDDQLADAESSVGMYHEWRRKFYNEGTEEVADAQFILDEILRYNKQDCESLEKVVQWLRTVLPERDGVEEGDGAGAVGNASEISAQGGEEMPEHEIVRGACGPTPQHKVEDSVAIRRCSELSQLLLTPSESSLDLGVRAVLANLLHFHVRESGPSRLQFAHRVNQAAGPNYKKLFEDDQCLCGVRFVSENRQDSMKAVVSFRYGFPKQQIQSLSSGNSAAFVVPSTNYAEKSEKSSISAFFTIKGFDQSLDPNSNSVILSPGRKKDLSPPRFGVLVSSEALKICDSPLRQGLLRSAERIFAGNMDPKVGLVNAFLKKTNIDREPFDGDFRLLFANTDYRRKVLGQFLASREQPCVFVVQGPPGSGKTSLSGGLIRDLVMEHGKTVAVSSNSHAAIDNLLSTAVTAGTCTNAVWKVGTRSSNSKIIGFKPRLKDLTIGKIEEEILEVDSSKFSTPRRRQKRKDFKAALVGATCYQLAREESEEKFDFLFIDEASQVTIANFLAMAACAKYAVLVGDQQQLEMPIKGNHPEALQQSCLSYIVGPNETTVRSSRGVFLEKSYRMNPQLCEFVSKFFYDNALSHAHNCGSNKIQLRSSAHGSGNILQKGEGLSFVAARGDESPDEFNPNAATYGKWHKEEEVRIVAEIIQELLGCAFIANGRGGQIDTSDILVVAPYNAQVRALVEALPNGVRVGTVDKFQGQEAAVAIVSTCTSGINDVSSVHEETWYASDGLWKSEEIPVERSQVAQKDHRGLRFSLRQNRLNVAISRAQCLSVVIGDPDIVFRMPTKNIDDIEIAALFEVLSQRGSEREL
eukprot:GFKZ01014170.1.p1 GENE.GFKZ01014170.1~~GFKZ01014170.1.p1  ORF type:complete len:1318 (-),score=205.27 GFKZ01014170.1:4417-8370(-)